MLLILASLIIPIIWLTYELKKHDKLEKNALNDFWRREEEANLVRKKPLDNLNYVEIPFDFIPESLLADNEEVKDCLELLNKLSEKKIVNFTGFSNTDLKWNTAPQILRSFPSMTKIILSMPARSISLQTSTTGTVMRAMPASFWKRRWKAAPT